MESVLAIDARKNARKVSIGENINANFIAVNLVVNDSYQTIIYNNQDNYLVYEENSLIYGNNLLSIDDEYLKNNKDEIKNYIINLIRNSKSSNMIISSTKLIDEDVLKELANNSNIKYVTLGNESDTYFLDRDSFNILNNGIIKSIYTNGIDKELREEFNPIISFNWKRKLLFDKNYQELNSDKIYIFNVSDNENENNIIYINPEADIIVKNDEYELLMPILSKINNKIRIEVNDKNKFNNYIFNHEEYVKDNIEIDNKVNNSLLPLNSYISYEKRLYDMIAPALELSPFEKYLYAYNIVKKFKRYKENKDNPMEARNLYKILDSEYIVCGGYKNLLLDLLSKLDIEACEFDLTVDTSLDMMSNSMEYIPLDVENSRGGHARALVRLFDPKYDIDGYYFADPTWDNDENNDYYNHALMTIDEFISTNRYNYYSYTVNELLFCKSIEEYYRAINYLMDKSSKRSNLYKNEKDVAKGLLNIIKKIDKEFYIDLASQYDLINIKDEEVGDILLIIGEIIIAKNNNMISVDSMRRGIEVLYRDIYGYSNYEERLDNTIESNKERQLEQFSPRYIIHKDDSREPYNNEINKWDGSNNRVIK